MTVVRWLLMTHALKPTRSTALLRMLMKTTVHRVVRQFHPIRLVRLIVKTSLNCNVHKTVCHTSVLKTNYCNTLKVIKDGELLQEILNPNFMQTKIH
jgi:hypothetical protein